MHRPVLVTPPTVLPVSLEEMKQALRILERDDDGNALEHEDDDLITDEIKSAAAHYEGWTGILGICLVDQTWRQDFDGFCRGLQLPLGPVVAPVSVTWRNRAGQIATINQAEYALETDAGGRSWLRFRNAYTLPADLYERRAVTVEYRAGWPVVEGASAVPADIKTAIKLRVIAAYDEAAREGAKNLVSMEYDLVSKYRRWSI